MNTETTEAAFGTSVHGNDFTNRLRGIQQHSAGFTAITQADSREFKTLRGAVSHMAAYGYDAYGRRL